MRRKSGGDEDEEAMLTHMLHQLYSEKHPTRHDAVRAINTLLLCNYLHCNVHDGKCVNAVCNRQQREHDGALGLLV